MSDKKHISAMEYLHLVSVGNPATPAERGHAECPCPKECTLHGECNLCTVYHARKNQLPRCQR